MIMFITHCADAKDTLTRNTEKFSYYACAYHECRHYMANMDDFVNNMYTAYGPLIESNIFNTVFEFRIV